MRSISIQEKLHEHTSIHTKNHQTFFLSSETEKIIKPLFYGLHFICARSTRVHTTDVKNNVMEYSTLFCHSMNGELDTLIQRLKLFKENGQDFIFHILGNKVKVI